MNGLSLSLLPLIFLFPHLYLFRPPSLSLLLSLASSYLTLPCEYLCWDHVLIMLNGFASLSLLVHLFSIHCPHCPLEVMLRGSTINCQWGWIESINIYYRAWNRILHYYFYNKICLPARLQLFSCFPCIYSTSLCHSLHKTSQSLLFNGPVPKGTLSLSNLPSSPHFRSLQVSRALEKCVSKAHIGKGGARKHPSET